MPVVPQLKHLNGYALVEDGSGRFIRISNEVCKTFEWLQFKAKLAVSKRATVYCKVEAADDLYNVYATVADGITFVSKSGVSISIPARLFDDLAVRAEKLCTGKLG